MGPGNGFVIREKNGSDSPIMRLGTRDGLAIGIRAYLSRLEEWQTDAIAAILNHKPGTYQDSAPIVKALNEIDPHYIPSLVDPDY